MSRDVLQQAVDALEHIVRRLQMDIDDGGRPDQWSMEDLVRKAKPAIARLESTLQQQPEPVAAFVRTDPSQSWTPEHCRSYPTEAAALLNARRQQPEPEYWQWRRKGDPWTLDKTFNSEVHATTPDSEVRALYASPSTPQEKS